MKRDRFAMASCAGRAEPTVATSVTRQALDQQVAVETPEQVLLSYTIAGIGSRSAAALIDTMLWAALVFLVLAAAGAFSGHLTRSSSWAVALLLLIAFAIFWAYFVLFEGLWDGQTPGKRQLGLRVVRDGGYSVGFAASAIRNLIRVIDMQPGGTYGIGIVCAVLSPTGKRLGDYAAGTMVVRERAITIGTGAPPSDVLGPDTTEMPPAAVLTDDEYALLDRYMERRNSIDAVRRAELAQQLVVRFRDRAPGLTGGDSAVLVRLHELERRARARGAPAHSGKGAAREQNAIVARGTPRWREFAALLASAQHRGLGAMSEAEVSDFVSRYRELAGDLARLQTAARGRELDSLFALSRLVAAGHSLLYRGHSLTWRSVWDYMTITVPAEIRRSVIPIGLAAAFLFVPAAIAWVSIVRHPALANQLIPAGMIDRAEHGAEWDRSGKGYVQIPDSIRPVAASGIMSNNIWVSTLTFAGGIAAGAGTLYTLTANGIELGAVMGLYQSKGILSLIVRFIAPHGVLELSAITLAGAAGLLIGSALLLPGTMTRREALVVRGRRAIRLIAATVFLLVVAGSLEGLVSPIPSWPLAWKLYVSAATVVFLVVYVYGRRTARADGVPGDGAAVGRASGRP
jgi:uncharacterized membrane protein SpoIIM required for sporulation/uncharacterized RDD family membrane protein YckC